ncbi:hypothetical protein EV126DRAFT_39843 [Verticillium dahliae]|nr:hypothetical protein EV126DRAFT_39843 [Verticillium dahliae]
MASQSSLGQPAGTRAAVSLRLYLLSLLLLGRTEGVFLHYPKRRHALSSPSPPYLVHAIHTISWPPRSRRKHTPLPPPIER